ncbi:hypothetical protein Dimus_016159, partial [Dionaea muscipula]
WFDLWNGLEVIIFGFDIVLAILRNVEIAFLCQAIPVDRIDGNRSTGTFGASLSGFGFLQERHPVDRMRGGTVEWLFEDLSVLFAEHDRFVPK